MRYISTAIILVLSLILGYISCSRGKEETKNVFSGKVDTVGVRVINLHTQNSKGKVNVRIFGITLPEKEVKVQPKVQGRVKKLYVDVGAYVKAGQVLAEIDDTDYLNIYKRTKAEVESIKSQLELARANYERAKNLIEKGAISQAEFDSAKYNYEALEARYKSALESLEQAKINLQETKIRAPFDGVIVSRNVSRGSYVFPQTPMFVIQSRRTYFLAKVPEEDAIFLKKGQKIRVYFPSLEKSVMGTIESISPSVDRRGFELKIVFSEFVPANVSGFADISIKRSRGIMLPYEALDIEKDGSYVFAVSDGVAKKVKVKIIDTFSDYVFAEIPSGITQIISPYTDKLYDGVKVKIVETAEKF